MQRMIWILLFVLFSGGNAFSSTFTVTSDEDNIAIPGTFRWAIQQANITPGSDLVIFSIGNSINVFSYVEITDPIMLSNNQTTVIGGDSVYLSPGSDGSTITGIAFIKEFGVFSNHNILQKCCFGSDWDHTNYINGIGLSISGSYNLIGGNDTQKNYFIYNTARNISINGGATRNNIQGNDISGGETGIYLQSSAGFNIIGGDRNSNRGNVLGGHVYGIYDEGAGGNTICGNIIGLDRNQLSSNNITSSGIYIVTSNNLIGITQTGYGNVICSSGIGLNIEGDRNIVRNNNIGISANDTVFANNTGIRLQFAAGENVIGGGRNLALNERNVISGNTTGIELGGSGNTISGNLIGLNSIGTLGRANSGNGIYIMGGGNNLIGGSNQDINSLKGNIISGNFTGVYAPVGNNNTIVGNYIGLNLAGTGTIENSQYGVVITGTNILGGSNPTLRNYICGSVDGVRISGSSTKIINNWFGILPNGVLSTEEFNAAIRVLGADNVIGSKNILSDNNLITNAVNGIRVEGAGADRNSFYGNTICAFNGAGISLDGAGANDNKAYPVILVPADVALIQGTTSGSNDFIEVFVSNRGAGLNGGSLRSVGTTTAVSGNWSLVPTGLVGGEYVCAIATDSSGNSSGFSLNQLVQVPTPTVTPTQTPTSTPTPATFVKVHSVKPEYYYTNRVGAFTIRGKAFQNPITVKLRRTGISDRDATNVNILGQEVLTCDFDLTGLPAGSYSLQAQITSSQDELLNALTVISEIAPPVRWDVYDAGQAGITAQTSIQRGLTVGDGNNDRQKEVYSAGLLQNLLQYKYGGAAGWAISQLPTGPIGEYYTDVIVCDMENDGENEVYGSTLDHQIYTFSGTNWSLKDDSGDLGSAVLGLAYGDGDNDNYIEIYASLENGNIYEFGFNGTSWSSTVVGNASGRMLDLAVGDGNQDGANEVYAACEDKNLYQFKYNGSAWVKTIVATGGDDMLSVAVGDGNQDGANEVYCTNLDGAVYQCKWSSGFFWNVTQVSTQPSRDVVVGDGDNDGNQEVYIAAINGHAYQCEYSANQWYSQDLGSAPDALFSLALGDGDNDYQLELYALAGDNHVYQFKASHSQPTPTPTKTPVPDFDGQIISKSYVYAAPNPIRGHIAKIHIMTLQPAEVSVKMFTTTNKEVMSFNRNYGTGMQIESLNMSNLANGVYFLLVKARAANGLEEKVIKKIALIK